MRLHVRPTQNMHLLLVFFAIALSCATADANDGPDDSPQAQAQRNAEADGAAVAVAVYCSNSNETIALYARALLNESKQYAAKNKIDFSEEVYRELEETSFNKIIGFMDSLSPTPQNRQENCDIVSKKIANALALKPINDASSRTTD